MEAALDASMERDFRSKCLVSAPTMSTYLAPAAGSSSTPLPTAPALSLLPLSLGTASAPFSTDTASTAHFFRPRPCPPDVPGIPEGTPVAAFRGRQLVGHSIGVPAGYRGLVISAPLPHLHQTKWPLTPAPSVASTSSALVDDGPSTRRSPRKSALASVASTIKAKVRGAGQVALAKPKTRQTKKEPAKRKRYQFDSEEEGEGGGTEVHLEHAPAKAEAKVETPRKGSTASTSVAEEVDLPTIVVQEATPLKEPLPTPKKRLGQKGSVTERMPTRPGLSRRETESPTPSSSASTSTEISTPTTEGVIPSPATENDPPAFSVDSLPASASAVVNTESEKIGTDSVAAAASLQSETEDSKPDVDGVGNADVKSGITLPDDIPADARALRPVSTFESFMLWTPDGPLPGFKQDERQESSGAEADAQRETAEQKAEEGGVKLRKGWWRTGGAGEGGDEVVRALGEWIGLVEEVRLALLKRCAGLCLMLTNVAQSPRVPGRPQRRGLRRRVKACVHACVYVPIHECMYLQLRDLASLAYAHFDLHQSRCTRCPRTLRR